MTTAVEFAQRKIDTAKQEIELANNRINELKEQLASGMVSIEHCKDIAIEFDYQRSIINKAQSDIELLNLALLVEKQANK